MKGTTTNTKQNNKQHIGFIVSLLFIILSKYTRTKNLINLFHLTTEKGMKLRKCVEVNFCRWCVCVSVSTCNVGICTINNNNSACYCRFGYVYGVSGQCS